MVSLRRVSFVRALLAGLVATVAAAIVAYGLLPLIDVTPLEGTGLVFVLAGGEGAALLFALLWDEIPPRTRPVSKAFVYTTIVFLISRLPVQAIPAAVAYALVLGAAYRPHPAPPEQPPRSVEPPVRAP